MSRSPSASGLLPMPGSASSSWALYRARFKSVFRNADTKVLVAFWLFGLINNVLYVIILSAAQDLVGGTPKGVVLLADVLPSFLTKLIAPYFIHRIAYSYRIPFFAALSSLGMLLVALSPTVSTKLLGVAFASLSSGAGELSFLGLTHFYGALSLAAWGSGTGGAGLAGAGLYVAMTDWWGFGVKRSLLVSALLPVVMLGAFFVVLPRGVLSGGGRGKEYEPVPDADGREGEEEDLHDEDVETIPPADAAASLLTPGPSVAATAYSAHPEREHHDQHGDEKSSSLAGHLRRAKALFLPYMLPLLLVYVAEYTINQGVAPTLLFLLGPGVPFGEYRAFYPFYGFLYQLGVFVSRSSTPFVRIRHLYVPSFLQIANLLLLGAHAIWDFIPSVYIVFAIVFWEGLLGGAVYVNTFAEIMENVPQEEREFSLGATSVSDSGGICLASVLSMGIEVWLCNYQVRHGRDYCKRIEANGVGR